MNVEVKDKNGRDIEFGDTVKYCHTTFIVKYLYFDNRGIPQLQGDEDVTFMVSANECEVIEVDTWYQVLDDLSSLNRCEGYEKLTGTDDCAQIYGCIACRAWQTELMQNRIKALIGA
jgi:hypothetical protein